MLVVSIDSVVVVVVVPIFVLGCLGDIELGPRVGSPIGVIAG